MVGDSFVQPPVDILNHGPLAFTTPCFWTDDNKCQRQLRGLLLHPDTDHAGILHVWMVQQFPFQLAGDDLQPFILDHFLDSVADPDEPFLVDRADIPGSEPPSPLMVDDKGVFGRVVVVDVAPCYIRTVTPDFGRFGRTTVTVDPVDIKHGVRIHESKLHIRRDAPYRAPLVHYSGNRDSRGKRARLRQSPRLVAVDGGSVRLLESGLDGSGELRAQRSRRGQDPLDAAQIVAGDAEILRQEKGNRRDQCQVLRPVSLDAAQIDVQVEPGHDDHCRASEKAAAGVQVEAVDVAEWQKSDYGLPSVRSFKDMLLPLLHICGHVFVRADDALCASRSARGEADECYAGVDLRWRSRGQLTWEAGSGQRLGRRRAIDRALSICLDDLPDRSACDGLLRSLQERRMYNEIFSLAYFQVRAELHGRQCRTVWRHCRPAADDRMADDGVVDGVGAEEGHNVVWLDSEPTEPMGKSLCAT